MFDGVTNPALIADATSRISGGEGGPRELHQVLFAARDHRAWAQARELAMAAAARVPATAVAVVGAGGPAAVGRRDAGRGVCRGGRLRCPGMAGPRRGARRGQGRNGSNKKAARQAAALSLLAALTGLAIPDADLPAARQAAPGRAGRPELPPPRLESWLDHQAGRPSPDPEFAGAIRPGRLSARSVYLLLFDADPRRDGPRPVPPPGRRWSALPRMAGGVLSMYSQARSWPTARLHRGREYSAVAFMPLVEGLVVGELTYAAGIQGRAGGRGPGVAQGPGSACPRAGAPHELTAIPWAC